MSYFLQHVMQWCGGSIVVDELCTVILFSRWDGKKTGENSLGKIDELIFLTLNAALVDIAALYSWNCVVLCALVACSIVQPNDLRQITGL